MVSGGNEEVSDHLQGDVIEEQGIQVIHWHGILQHAPPTSHPEKFA